MNILKSNIVLIGFMGTGKTSTGRIIARRMKRKFVDTDELIEEDAGLSIKEIFKKKDEKYFRKIEKKVIKIVSDKKNLVISTGGGIIKYPVNIKRLKKNGVVVALLSDEKVILRRVSTQKDKRPLLNSGNRAQDQKRLRELLQKRLPLYFEAADYVVDASRLAPAQAAKKILCVLKKD
ncbi:MAG: shikimate kinase [Candidatus Firestonebacteria bacterium]